jgi:serine phosphatase RsbU (regulator of sigma subunit)
VKNSARPLRGFAHVLWLPLVCSLPIALFFGTLDWLGWLGYLIAYQLALVFTYPIALAVWITRAFVVPRNRARSPLRRRIWSREVLPTTISALVGALAGIGILEAMQSGTVRGALTVVQILMFTLLFSALALAVTYAIAFHGDSVERTRTDAELRLARQLQLAMIGHSMPDGLALDVHGALVPSRQVSGDFYDIIPTGDGEVFLAIADVAGQRMPAALLSSSLLAALRMQTSAHAAVEDIVRNINLLACQGRITDERLFAAMFLARLQPVTGRLQYTNAGHRHPRVLRKSGETVSLEQGGTVIGMLESAGYARGSVALEPGDRVLMFTDGIVEAANRQGEMFGEDRLVTLVRSLPLERTARQITETVLASVREFQNGQEAADDLTLLAVCVPEA